IYIDDGKILLKVSDKGKKSLKCKVLSGGLLQERKGINIVDVNLEFDAITEKDRRDLSVALKYGLDYLAQSFVRSKEDIKKLRKLINKSHPECKIFAKVESRQALRNIKGIVREADGIIVARGDLGICLPIYKVPVIQKKIVKLCLENKKPVVVATQMLDSMIKSNIPTRAEASDVANAILDGATHLLLSAETAIGDYPAKVVDVMNKIIKNTEQYQKETP
ncbi:MAG: pyruvate kinase, partial [Candidatus Omnitrophica bacterium]|nr:pyruvate kinase [Candidatus Omnitrophota bacterium]MBD3269662.1 pyruvate kinase [Candidatus Omnitrophota bacterium]